MKVLGYCLRSCLLTWVSLTTYGVHAQLGTYTDEDTGIVFSTQTISSSSTEGGLVWGWVLPPDAATVTATEYIGLIIGSLSTDGGWAGISHGGSMVNALLLMGWPNSGKILTSFRYATGYDTPVLYNGKVTLTQISHSVNDTHYKIIYRCQGCWSWDQDGASDSRDTTTGVMVIGWAQAYQYPDDPTDPDSSIIQHDTQGLFGAPVASAVHSSYSAWATMGGGGGPTTTTTSPPTTTTTTAPSVTGKPVPTGAWDYVVVGGGAGGIPVADKLSESGAKVLLIEKGPPSTYQWGGRLGPDWLHGNELTRFDVPGLCNEIWVDSAGIACSDIDQMAGCVLGGGTAVNAGLWWKAPDVDWDYNFPTGWKSTDMSPIVDRVFSRIPGTYIPSMDGKLYLQQGYDVLTSGMAAAGWEYVVANDVRNKKNRAYAHTPFMFSNGERGGPMATYLKTASQRSNFKLWMNTAVRRVIRSGGHVTGVEVEAQTNDGYTGIVNLTELTGRVVLSAGTFGSAKILMRSGIGPQDMLKVVQGSAKDGATMINSTEWINLPVGYNLDDHTNTDTVITHPNVTFYDFYEAWDNPIAADEAAYLDHRSGILATAAPNIGPMMWEVVTPSDGIPRQLQWTSRVEASRDVKSDYAMTMSQYLGRGSQSRGRLTITSGLTMTVSTLPYLQNAGDVEAVIMGINHLRDALKSIPNLEWQQPAADQTAEDYVKNYIITASTRRANHWIGTAKIGPDDGRNGGTAVVDLNTRVWGMDNLFVADASIFPGMVTTNPSALVVTVAERAAEKILALPPLKRVDPYSVCGGSNYTGSHVCAQGTTCRYYHPWLSQCWPN